MENAGLYLITIHELSMNKKTSLKTKIITGLEAGNPYPLYDVQLYLHNLLRYTALAQDLTIFDEMIEVHS
jgi:hypothetical protein